MPARRPPSAATKAANKPRVFIASSQSRGSASIVALHGACRCIPADDKAALPGRAGKFHARAKNSARVVRSAGVGGGACREYDGSEAQVTSAGQAGPETHAFQKHPSQIYISNGLLITAQSRNGGHRA